jgi:hypothetical protein
LAINQIVRIQIGDEKKLDDSHIIEYKGFIGAHTCQQIAELLNKEQKRGFALIIIFPKDVKKIDILFIANLIILRSKYDIINIVLKVYKINDEVKFTLYQYLFLGSLAFKNTLFKIDENYSDNEKIEEHEYPYALGYFAVSNSFSPIFKISTIID